VRLTLPSGAASMSPNPLRADLIYPGSSSRKNDVLSCLKQ
jgi:hypothetical protein